MLADPQFKVPDEEQKAGFIEAVKDEMTREEALAYIHDTYSPDRLTGYPVGVFWAFNFELVVTNLVTHYWCIPGITIRQPEDQDNPQFKALCGHEGWELNQYGVCDTPEQVFARYCIAEIPDRKFCVAFATIVRSEQPESGGWRWHKWGPYIGNFEPKCEYIYDEKGIDQVLLYHIYEIDEGNPS